MAGQLALRTFGAHAPSRTTLVVRNRRLTAVEPIKVPTPELVTWLRCFVSMHKSGIVVGRILETLAESGPSQELRQCSERILQHQIHGQPFSQALLRAGFPLGEHGLTLVRIGETTGSLHEIMELLTESFEKEDHYRRRLTTSLIYPAILAVASLVLGAVLLLFVTPAFVQLLDGLQAQLSAVSRFCIWLAGWLSDPLVWIVFLQAVVLLVAEVVFWRRSATGRLAFDRMLLRLPVVGRFLTAVAMARLAYLLSLLLKTGCTLNQAMRTVAGATGNLVLQNSLEAAEKRIRLRGATLRQALHRAEGFDRLFLDFAAIGEDSGRLESMLGRVHELYEQESARLGEAVAAVLEPMVLALMGCLVGGVLLLLFVPLSELGRAL